MQRIFFIIFIFLFFFEAKGQDEKSYPIELGINITTVLSTFIGNENNLDATDFPMQVRLGRNSTKFRIGLGAESSNKTIFDQLTLTNRRSKNIGVASRFGIEFNQPLGKRFGYYWGADAILLFSNNEVNASFLGSFIKEQTIGVGGGPILGLRYKLSDRVYLSSEATIYGVYRSQKRSSSTDDPTTDSFFDLVINPPLFLYLNISLGK